MRFYILIVVVVFVFVGIVVVKIYLFGSEDYLKFSFFLVMLFVCLLI